MALARSTLRFAVPGLALLLGLSASTPGRADPRLAGAFLVTDTHGQPICPTRPQLQRYLAATIAQAPVSAATFGCVIAPYAARVQVLQDLPPYGTRMHVVRALAATPLQRVEGYTYSVGLYDARRFAPYSPYGDYFPDVP